MVKNMAKTNRTEKHLHTKSVKHDGEEKAYRDFTSPASNPYPAQPAPEYLFSPFFGGGCLGGVSWNTFPAWTGFTRVMRGVHLLLR